MSVDTAALHWYDLADYWPEFEQIARQRLVYHIRRSSHVPPDSTDSEVCSVVGDYLWRAHTGTLPVPTEPLRGPQEVRTRSTFRVGSRLLVRWKPDVEREQARWPQKFVLVWVDKDAKRAALVGWATKQEVAAAPVRSWPDGPAYTLELGALHPFRQKGREVE
jgi:hypothetical protein